MAVFRQKVHFSRRKSATNFPCVKTASDKVLRHSLAYLSVHKWLLVDVPFYFKLRPTLTHPVKNADFQSVFARSASAVTPSEKKFS